MRKYKKFPAMPDKFIPLAQYNAEKYAGIVHTKEYDAFMKLLQEEYNTWHAEACAEAGYTVTPKRI